MCRRPLADVRRPLAGFFSRMCTGTPMASPNCPAAAQTMCVDVTAPRGACSCLCPVSSGHALRAVQPASESACSFLFLQPSADPSVHCTFLLYTFCTPSVRLLYTFCTFCTCLDAPQTLLVHHRNAYRTCRPRQKHATTRREPTHRALSTMHSCLMSVGLGALGRPTSQSPRTNLA